MGEIIVRENVQPERITDNRNAGWVVYAPVPPGHMVPINSEGSEFAWVLGDMRDSSPQHDDIELASHANRVTERRREIQAIRGESEKVLLTKIGRGCGVIIGGGLLCGAIYWLSQFKP